MLWVDSLFLREFRDLQWRRVTSDFYRQLYRLNLGNVVLLYGLVACAIYEKKLKDAEIRHFVEQVRAQGNFSGVEVLQMTRRLRDRAFKGKIKGTDDAYARLLSTAVSIYRGTIDNEDDLPVIWCDTWLSLIMTTMVRDPKDVEARMLNAVIRFESHFLSASPLPNTIQQAILKGFSQA